MYASLGIAKQRQNQLLALVRHLLSNYAHHRNLQDLASEAARSTQDQNEIRFILIAVDEELEDRGFQLQVRTVVLEGLRDLISYAALEIEMRLAEQSEEPTEGLVGAERPGAFNIVTPLNG